MNNNIKNIEPKEIWGHFADINTIPRASKKEEAISDFMVEFAKRLGLEVKQDHALNVLIKKNATPGFEHRKTVVMQSHIDMVHQKNKDTVFDFDTQGINMYIDGDWVKAKGTTLGADNGIGVATIMGVLASKDIQHPNIEALFTVDEETGMTGAFELQPHFLSGDILLNLDTEEDDEITIGCAGGIDVTATKTYSPVVSHADVFYNIQLKGLNGGHSGIDIHKKLGNANQLLNRVLSEINSTIAFDLLSFKGGNLRNAIPREAEAFIGTSESNVHSLLSTIEEQKIILQTEFKTLDTRLDISITEVEIKDRSCLSSKEKENFLNTLYSTLHGVYTMDAGITDLVATSNNIAAVKVGNGNIKIDCLTRSSIESEKQDLANKLKATFTLGDFKTETSGDYPGWQPNLNSGIVNIMTDIYQTLFKTPPNVNACHAGLECGIIGRYYPQMEMVSFGPTIKGAHTPEEKASIISVQKFWHFSIEILKNIPIK